MDTKALRRAAIDDMLTQVRPAMAAGATVENLEEAKRALLELCEHQALFTLDDFPGPTGAQTERTYLIHEDPDGRYALYVNSGGPQQSAPPHDHGGSWAIVAAVSGEEAHRLYVDDAPETAELPAIRQVAEITVKPGTAVSMLPDGIHSIHGASQNLIHLHLYGLRFSSQTERRTYDLEAGTVRRFILEDVGFVEDAR